MKQLFYYALLWAISGGLYVRGSEVNTQVVVTETSNYNTAVTSEAPVRLKEIDIANPLFIFK